MVYYLSPVGIGVIGVGSWGKNHARVFSELEQANLVAIADRDNEKAKNFAKKFGAHHYSEVDELLRQEEVDAVTICTPTVTHADLALQAIEAGKHLLVEKPIANTVRQTRKIVDATEKNELQLMVGFIERFNPGVQQAKSEIEAGKIGTLVSATARRVSQWPERIGDIGVVKDTAIHDIDIMRYIFDQDPIAVYAQIGNLRHKKFEDYAQIMLTFENGKTAFIEANWLTPYKIRNLLVTGSEAIISLSYITQEITMEIAGQSLTHKHEWKEPLKLELQHFANCVITDEEPLVTGNDGLKALQIAEGAIKSAAKCRAIKL